MNITEKIKSFEDAVQWHKENTGTDYSNLPIVEGIPVVLAAPIVSIYKLWVIAAALREGKKLKVGYYPWFWLDRAGSGSGFSFFGYFYVSAYSDVGALLEYPDDDIAEYAGEQFIDLYRDIMIIPAK